MGQMNFRDEASIADATTLAGLLGASVPVALRQAIQGRLARKGSRRRDGKRRTVAALMAMSGRASKLVPIGVTSDRGAPL